MPHKSLSAGPHRDAAEKRSLTEAPARLYIPAKYSVSTPQEGCDFRPVILESDTGLRMARKREGLVILYTGNGKGKTTAALGTLLRAWGRGMSVVMLSFIKAKTANFGEQRAARKLGIEMLALGQGFTWLSRDISVDQELARKGWDLCKQKLASGDYDVVVLDEITHPINFGWLSLDDVMQTIARRPKGTHVILTGRDAPSGLIAFADLVTEMREVKHPFQQGMKAQPGIDF